MRANRRTKSVEIAGRILGPGLPSLGDGRKRPAESEADTAAVGRRSIVSAQDIRRGAVLMEDMIAITRPGADLPPAIYSYVIGRTASMAIPADALIMLEMLV